MAVMFAAGRIYARVGASGFAVMAALCLIALPLAWKLRERRRPTPSAGTASCCLLEMMPAADAPGARRAGQAWPWPR